MSSGAGTTGPARWWAALPWLFVLLGAAGFVVGRARVPATEAGPAAAGFWEARHADGARFAPTPGASGLALGTGDVLRLKDAEVFRYSLTSLALTLRPEAGASLLLVLREADGRSYALVVAPGARPGLQFSYREPGAQPAALKQAPLDVADGQAVELRVDIDGDRFRVHVDDREALSVRDGRLTEGRASLTVRRGACRLEALSLKAARTTQGGLVEDAEKREDFAPRDVPSSWTAHAASVGWAAGALLVAALYLRALSRGRPGFSRLAQASAIFAAPVALLHVQGLFREPVLPGPLVAGLGVVGLLLALRMLGAGAAASAPPRASGGAAGSTAGSAAGPAVGAAVVLGLAAATVLGVQRAVEAVEKPLLVQERIALKLPLPTPYALAEPLELDAGNSVVLPGPFRDFDLRAELTPQEDTAIELRVRATAPPSCRGIALWVPTDERQRTGLVLEDMRDFAPLGEQLPAVRAGERVLLEFRLRGREFEAAVNGRSVRAESLDFASGAVVLMAAHGTATLHELTLTPQPSSAGDAAAELPASGLSRAALLPLLLPLLFAVLAAGLLRAPFFAMLEGCAFALLPLALWLFAETATAAPAPLTPATLAQLSACTALLLLVPVFVQARGRVIWRVVVLVAVAAAGAPLAIAAASPPVALSNWQAWSGERLEDDLAWLQHPAMRALNGYLADHAFRGRHITVGKQAGSARVITLGASTTYGFGVAEGTGREYPMVLERLLNEEPPGSRPGQAPRGAGQAPSGAAPRVEVLNAAFLGANTEQQFRLLRDALLVFAPDVVTLSLYYNDSFSLTSMDVADTVARVCAADYRRTLLDDALQAWKLSGASHRTSRLSAAYREWEGRTLELWESMGPGSGERSPAERYEAVLRRFAELGRERGFALVLIKEPVRDEHTIWKEEFYAAMDRVAADYGLRVVDPWPALQAAGGAALFMDTVHLRPEGLTIMAEQIAPVVRDVLARPPH